MLYGFEVTGSNSYMYSKKHLEAHYNKENGSKSLAIESQGLLLQKRDEDGKKNLPVFFYILYSQYMIFFRDFNLFFSEPNIPAKEWIRLFFSKLIYSFAFLVLPFIVHPLPWWQVLVALLFMYLVVTGFLVIILLMPTEKMEQQRENGNSTNDQWLIEILEHNVDFSPSSTLINLAAGGANLNVVHYLFHSANHVHYNKLAGIIEKTAGEFGLQYRKQQVKDIFGIHFNYLKNIQGSKS
jgi:linoleoyl-CoA desaturase